MVEKTVQKTPVAKTASKVKQARALAHAVIPAGEAAKVIQYPIATEKAVSGIETRNEITLVVSMAANKKQIKADAERMFGAKVLKVRTAIQMGRKKAVIKFAKAGTASDVAAKLKIM